MAIKSSRNRSLTFKSRVASFWEWFPQIAVRHEKSIADGDPREFMEEVSQFMEDHLPCLSWAVGYEPNEGFSLTLTGEGQVPKQFLAEYWQKHSVSIPNWTFFASRQPSKPEALNDIGIRISETAVVDAVNMIIRTRVDEESQAIDIAAWHPAWESLPEENQYQILFLLLDETLGEFGTQTWLGEIHIEPLEDERGMRKLSELPKFIQQASSYHGWQKLPPLQAYSVYEVPEPSELPRGDTIVGSSCVPDVIFEYMELGGRLDEDPLDGCGAALLYLAIDGDVFPEGNETDTRSQIEDKLDEVLGATGSGKTVGGAFGTRMSYIDLIIYDGKASRTLIEKTLQDLQLGDKYRIVDFLE